MNPLIVRWVVLTQCIFLLAKAMAAEVESRPPEFFAFQNGLNLPTTELVPALKTLGFDGLSTEGYDVVGIQSALKTRGLRLYNTYIGMDLDGNHPARTAPFEKLVDQLQGSGAAIWLTIPKVTRNGRNFSPSDPEGDAVAVPRIRELADYAEPRGVRIALYPHTGTWVERLDDAARVADKLGRPGVGSTFNLCHWLKVEGDRDPLPALRSALPRLLFVSINGAEGGDTRQSDWAKLIQPLGQGSYDVGKLVREVRAIGYKGPFGLQGYGLKGDSMENGRRSIAAWRQMTANPVP